MAVITGPEGSSADVPRASFAEGCKGTPKSITERRPRRIRGARKGISLLTPRRYWFGREGIGVSSSGLSVMKSG